MPGGEPELNKENSLLHLLPALGMLKMAVTGASGHKAFGCSVDLCR